MKNKTLPVIIIVLLLVVVAALIFTLGGRDVLSPDNDTVNGQDNVLLYYHNTELDPDFDGGVFPVERAIQVEEDIVRETIELLIEGRLTPEEIAQGFDTEFPHPDFQLLDSRLENGTLTLTFTEVPGFTTGGALRVTIMRSSVEQTALQFDEVDEVVIMPEEIFQP